jgi:hypothetical protein
MLSFATCQSQTSPLGGRQQSIPAQTFCTTALAISRDEEAIDVDEERVDRPELGDK